MAHILQDPYEQARINFEISVRRWQSLGANKSELEAELEFLFNIDTSTAPDPAGNIGWEP